MSLFILAASGGYVLGAGRTVPSIVALLALAGVVVGVLARSGRGAERRRTLAGTSVVLSAIGLVVGGLHLAYSGGGPGTGNGWVGAFAAVVLGIIGLVLGGLAWARRAPVSSGR